MSFSLANPSSFNLPLYSRPALSRTVYDRPPYVAPTPVSSTKQKLTHCPRNEQAGVLSLKKGCFLASKYMAYSLLLTRWINITNATIRHFYRFKVGGIAVAISVPIGKVLTPTSLPSTWNIYPIIVKGGSFLISQIQHNLEFFPRQLISLYNAPYPRLLQVTHRIQ